MGIGFGAFNQKGITAVGRAVVYDDNFMGVGER